MNGPVIARPFPEVICHAWRIPIAMISPLIKPDGNEPKTTIAGSAKMKKITAPNAKMSEPFFAEVEPFAGAVAATDESASAPPGGVESDAPAVAVARCPVASFSASGVYAKPTEKYVRAAARI